jgi:two-component system response regulator DesR
MGTAAIDNLRPQSGQQPDERLQSVEVLLVEDDRAASYSLWALLTWQPGVHVCATTETADEALTLVREQRPDVCLVAAGLERGRGVAVAHRLIQVPDPPRVLMYDDRVGADLRDRASIAGAKGAFSRYGDPNDVARAIKCTAVGKQSPAAFTPAEIGALIDCVEDRDRAIAAMLLLATAPDEIACTLGISVSQMRERRRQMVKRLGARPVGGRDKRGQAPEPDPQRDGRLLRLRGGSRRRQLDGVAADHR